MKLHSISLLLLPLLCAAPASADPNPAGTAIIQRKAAEMRLCMHNSASMHVQDTATMVLVCGFDFVKYMAQFGYSKPELHVWVTKIAEEEEEKVAIAEANRRAAPLTPDRNRELDLLTTPPPD